MNKITKFIATLILLPVTVVTANYLVQTLTLDAQVSAQQTNLQQRVETYKKKLQTQPSKGDLDKLKLRCSVAQERLKTASKKTLTVQEKRSKAYDSINKSLADLTEVLKKKSINTTNLEAQSKELKSKTDTFNTDMAAYKQAIEDAANADCATDPLALKASLEDARNTRTKLVQEVADIRTYINNVIKTTLSQIKTDLKTQKAANDANTGEPLPDSNINLNHQPNNAQPTVNSTQPSGGANSATQ